MYFPHFNHEITNGSGKQRAEFFCENLLLSLFFFKNNGSQHRIFMEQANRARVA